MRSLLKTLLLSSFLFAVPALAADDTDESSSESSESSEPSTQETPAPSPTSDRCGEGKVCCNVYDGSPTERGARKMCLPEDECTGIGKDKVPDFYCK